MCVTVCVCVPMCRTASSVVISGKSDSGPRKDVCLCVCTSVCGDVQDCNGCRELGEIKNLGIARMCVLVFVCLCVRARGNA